MRFFFIFTFSLLALHLIGQHNISGIVQNEEGEYLEYAVIYIEGTKYSASTERGGTFSLQGIAPGQYTIACSFLGYNTMKKEVTINGDVEVDFTMTGQLFNLPQVEIKSNVNKLTSFPATSEVSKETLRKDNLGQDVPILLQWLPSVTTTSDAGAGIGYTAMRIRGVDQSRINVTINDVPLNDSESQGVFWVDLPDFASSTESVKVQRGVGPSTNGAGAYGGTIGLNSFGLSVNPYAEVNASLGSFNTSKLGVTLNTGLMNNQYNVEARYSVIKSDGYIDRASSDLSSWYIEAAKVNSKSSLRFLAYSGKERTYQSWNGAPEALVNGDKAGLLEHYNNNVGSLYKNAADSLNLFGSDRRYNAYLYEDQVDQYTQTHTQLHWARTLSDKFTAKVSLHYTRGLGYFEQYRYNDKLGNYNYGPIVIDDDTISKSTVVRQRWLDNHFYGTIAKVEYMPSANNIWSVGGGYNAYDGNHFGYLTFVEKLTEPYINHTYYTNKGKKKDGNVYVRYETALSSKITMSGDLQYRSVKYDVAGIDNDLRSIGVAEEYNFFNPKFSFNYKLSASQKLTASYAVAHREPDRSDFLDNPKSKLPLHESLYDSELGYTLKKDKVTMEANVYYMNYKNQLVITGELNDVGSNLRINTPKSYRLGLELTVNTAISPKLLWQVNGTFSKNKIDQFTEVLYDYTNGYDVIYNNYSNVDISFSPNVVAANVLSFHPKSSLEIALSAKYIGGQYLDNTMNEQRKLPAYTYTNLRLAYAPKLSFAKKATFTLQLNNLFNTLYSSNGYSYSYKYGNLITENFLYPQAGLNFMVGMSVKL